MAKYLIGIDGGGTSTRARLVRADGAVIGFGEAVHADGRRESVSGWGFPVGDEGSGAWLGLSAMREAQRALDGRGKAGALAQAVWGLAGGTREALFAWCEHAGQHAYAKLAPLVFDAE